MFKIGGVLQIKSSTSGQLGYSVTDAITIKRIAVFRLASHQYRYSNEYIGFESCYSDSYVNIADISVSPRY